MERLASTAKLMWPAEEGAWRDGTRGWSAECSWLAGEVGLSNVDIDMALTNRARRNPIHVDPGLPAAMTDPAKLKPLLVQTLRTAILHCRCVDVWCGASVVETHALLY